MKPGETLTRYDTVYVAVADKEGSVPCGNCAFDSVQALPCPRGDKAGELLCLRVKPTDQGLHFMEEQKFYIERLKGNV